MGRPRAVAHRGADHHNWRFTLLAAGVSESAAAKAYRLLRAILATAADDRVIPRNPCRIRGAGDEKPAERPVLTVAQVFGLADRMKESPVQGADPAGHLRQPALG